MVEILRYNANLGANLCFIIFLRSIFTTDRKISFCLEDAFSEPIFSNFCPTCQTAIAMEFHETLATDIRSLIHKRTTVLFSRFPASHF